MENNNVEATKEVIVAKGLTHKEANELRSILTKNVRRLWIMVKNTRVDGIYDVAIANDWGGLPSTEQKELAMTFATGLQELTNESVSVNDDDVEDITDQVTIVS